MILFTVYVRTHVRFQKYSGVDKLPREDLVDVLKGPQEMFMSVSMNIIRNSNGGGATSHLKDRESRQMIPSLLARCVITS